MDVDYPIWVAPHEIRRQDTHIARKHDDVDVVFLDELQYVSFSFCLVGVSHRMERYAGRVG